MTGCGPVGDGPRELPPTSRFAADDGSADPHLAAVLAAHAQGSADLADVVAALTPTRVLVPVLAHERPTDASPGTSGGERHAQTAVVGVQVPDGRTGLPAFTCTAAMSAWHADARPMPAEAARAAASALAEGWQVLVLDPAGPVGVVVPRPAVQAMAMGLPWQPAVRGGTVRSDVAEAVVRCLADVEHVLEVRVEAGRRAELAVVLGLAPGLVRSQLDEVVARVNRRLAGDPMVAQADSLELRPVAVG